MNETGYFNLHKSVASLLNTISINYSHPTLFQATKWIHGLRNEVRIAEHILVIYNKPNVGQRGAEDGQLYRVTPYRIETIISCRKESISVYHFLGVKVAFPLANTTILGEQETGEFYCPRHITGLKKYSWDTYSLFQFCIYIYCPRHITGLKKYPWDTYTLFQFCICSYHNALR